MLHTLNPVHERQAVHYAASGNGSHRFYHPELDALRFFAFLAVFFHHALPRDVVPYVSAGLSTNAVQWLLTAKEAGAFGLDLFFTLSAYLITELLIREHLNAGTIDIRAFYIRRALRIWPLYLVFIGATIFLIPLILPGDKFGDSYAVSYLLFSGNWVSAVAGIPFSVAGPLWSISVEEQFYVAWPLLLLLLGVSHIRRLAFIMLGVAVGARIILAAYGVGHPGVWCNTLARLDPLALGALLAFTLRGRAPQLNAAFRIGLGGSALVLWLLAAKYLSQDGPTSLATYPLIAVASLMMLIAALRTDATLLLRAPFKCLVYLGRISYGLYVFHLLALTLISKQLSIPLLGIPLNFERRLILSFLMTVILAAASYRWLERPFLRLKSRFTHVPSHSADDVRQPWIHAGTAMLTNRT